MCAVASATSVVAAASPVPDADPAVSDAASVAAAA